MRVPGAGSQPRHSPRTPVTSRASPVMTEAQRPAITSISVSTDCAIDTVRGREHKQDDKDRDQPTNPTGQHTGDRDPQPQQTKYVRTIALTHGTVVAPRSSGGGSEHTGELGEQRQN